MADEHRQVSVYYGAKACGWSAISLHFLELKGLSGREGEGKTAREALSVLMVAKKNEPSLCRVDHMRTIHGGVFRLINSTLRTVSSKVIVKLVVSLQPVQ